MIEPKNIPKSNLLCKEQFVQGFLIGFFKHVFMRIKINTI